MAEKVGEVWVESYQPTDENGLPVGPPQKFEGKTQQDLIEKLKAAHMNASVKLYQTRKAVKLGTVLEPDPEEPIQTFEERQLTADERVKVSKMLNDPATAAEAHQILLEAQFGAPLKTIRARLRDLEIQTRISAIRDAVEQFKIETPAYVESVSNGENLKQYMEKKNLRYTVKNLKIAFEDLVNDGLLTVRAPEPPKAAEPQPAPVPPAAAAPVQVETIPQPVTNAPAIPVEPTDVRPRQSSSGLGRDNSSATSGGALPKTAGISIRDVNKMSAAEYHEALRNPEFRKQVDALYAKK